MSEGLNNETCISPEANRASDAYRVTALIILIIAILVLVTGILLWMRQRKRICLQRRNPALVWLNLVPLTCMIITGPVRRYYLNDPGKIVENCVFYNILFPMVVPSFVIPNTVRIMNFHYRLKLHHKLSRIHRRNNLGSDATVEDEAGADPPRNPVFFRSKIRAVGLLSSQRLSMNTQTFRDIRRLRFKAGSRYAFYLALILLLLALICSMVFAIVSCDLLKDDKSDCSFGNTQGFGLVLVLVPLIPIVGLYFYFKHLVKQTPDPFGIKAEIDNFTRLIIAGFIVTMVNLFDPGNFDKTGDESDELISFKWITLIDFLVMLGFMNSVHLQIWKAMKFDESVKKVFPMSLGEVINHPEGCDLFRVFLQTDFSVENLVLYQLISEWKKHFDTMDPADRDVEARERLFKRWLDKSLSTDSGMNISSSCLETLALQFAEDGPYPETVFDEVLNELFRLMESDSFIRFVNTGEYKVFVGAKDPVDYI